MPIGPNIAIVGAGNRLAAIPVLATIFNLPLDMGAKITLCDSNTEMLDLFERLARAFAAYNGAPGIAIHSTDSVEEAMADADALFICIDIGERTDELEDRIAAVVIGREDAEAVIRVEMLRDELLQISDYLKPGGEQLVFNLVYRTDLSGTLINAPAFHIDWPERVPEEEQYRFAHRGLRLIRGDDPIFEPLQEYKENPLATAILDARPAPENRFDPTALTKVSWELLGR
ncbi:MAG: hypothetical protein ABIV13_06325 [Fimbriimonadales bacterium]